ncbi:hypothetical protein [Krasilnikovia sp. M28-CT-15]|uniref:hypothetical protein n=1 Tax=Krasilnikovia sp. M28-CT-15 TaxID=3373540 RepID=UPI00399D4DD9
MLKDLETAAQAYADAQGAIAEAQQALSAARDDVRIARQGLADAIVAATLAGARQIDVMKVTGYSREQIRRILRAAGVEASTNS